ncbi:hypothetical protein C3943_22255 [Lysinibacillus sp. B2A1]|nr:hypothetical protein C3943_22255 [Lysinibacillus sp. B2A1]
MNDFKKEDPAVTEAEVKQTESFKAEIMATKKIESTDLVGLTNSEIALRLYFLISNGSNKKFEDYYDIGNLLGCIAANYID